MEEKKEVAGMLELMLRPGFCVKDQIITAVNQEAQSLLIFPGTDVRSLLLTGAEEYAAFREGCLYLKLNLTEQGCGAAVVRLEEEDVFILDQASDDSELQCLSLAARELREPLANVMISASQMIRHADAAGKAQAAYLNRGLYQLMRIVGNMSDAGRCSVSSRQETRDLAAIFREIFEKAQALTAHAGVSLTYQGLTQEVLALADEEQLERAVMNILSNALKFTPRGGSIAAKLTRHGQMLRLSVTDSGSGIAEGVRRNVFSRYLRQPGIEDIRYGIGLGMVLIRSAAANHGGTVLIDRPEGAGTRVTLTLALRQDGDGTLRSPVLRVDYAGEQDHGLIELSDCLPADLYEGR